MAAVPERAGGVEVVPVDLAPVAPRAPVEERLAGDFHGRRARVECERELAEVGGILRRGVAVEEDGAPAAAEGARGGGGPRPRRGETADGGEDERLAGAIAERDLEHRAGERCDVRAAGHERAPRGQRRIAGKARVAERPLRDGELAAQRDGAEVRQAAERIGVGPEAEAGEEPVARAGEFAGEVAVQDARVQDAPALPLGAHGEVRHPVAAPLGGAVENLPLRQIAVAGHADAARADAADGKRNGAQTGS